MIYLTSNYRLYRLTNAQYERYLQDVVEEKRKPLDYYGEYICSA